MISLLGVLLWDVHCMTALYSEVFVHEALGDLEEDQEALATDLAHRVLQMRDDMLGQSKVEASLDLIAVASLEDRAYHG